MGYNNEASWDSRLESVENELREREGNAYDPDLSRAISCLNEARMMIFRWRKPGWFEQYHFERSSSEASAGEADASEDASEDFFSIEPLPCDCPVYALGAGLDGSVEFVLTFTEEYPGQHWGFYKEFFGRN